MVDDIRCMFDDDDDDVVVWVAEENNKTWLSPKQQEEEVQQQSSYRSFRPHQILAVPMVVVAGNNTNKWTKQGKKQYKEQQAGRLCVFFFCWRCRFIRLIIIITYFPMCLGSDIASYTNATPHNKVSASKTKKNPRI